MNHPLRIAVISTPRAGNTWIRHLLGTAYEIPHFARHSMNDADWAALPAEVVLQIHWRREPAFVERLNKHGFRVVTVARHPLDVLISILHFCVYESESEQWLLGAGGSEADIYASMPRSRTFVEYAKSPRAKELLSVTPDWRGQPNVVGVKYEDCVRDAEGELRKLEAFLGPIRASSHHDVVEKCSMGELRKGAINNHFWKGSPGLWRSLLPARETREIAAAIGEFAFAPFGYVCDPDESLTELDADRNWSRLVGDEVKRTLRKSTDGHRAELKVREEQLATVSANYESLIKRLERSLVLSGAIAGRIKRALQKYPKLAGLIRGRRSSLRHPPESGEQGSGADGSQH